MADADQHNETDRTHLHNPLASALDHMLQDKVARPRDIYRLAVLVAALLDSLDQPDALQTIRTELQVLIQDLAPSSNEKE